METSLPPDTSIPDTHDSGPITFKVTQEPSCCSYNCKWDRRHMFKDTSLDLFGNLGCTFFTGFWKYYQRLPNSHFCQD